MVHGHRISSVGDKDVLKLNQGGGGFITLYNYYKL